MKKKSTTKSREKVFDTLNSGPPLQFAPTWRHITKQDYFDQLPGDITLGQAEKLWFLHLRLTTKQP